MDEALWKKIGVIKHEIRQSLSKAVKIELMAKEAVKVVALAQDLREEIKDELQKFDNIINELGEKEDEKSKDLINCPTCDSVVKSDSVRI